MSQVCLKYDTQPKWSPGLKTITSIIAVSLLHKEWSNQAMKRIGWLNQLLRADTLAFISSLLHIVIHAVKK